ncbi:ThuA domain-containing protein [Crateriforma conspicua]|uniref:ThuA domain-containing protein n=1 Tax=Crateriforma conspicua TaxID=2527996 RepID=UPI00118A07E7|nr:ThuA domain-containing protein [Crateriforma conspicua]QDV62748.1 Trehalose utilization [Crateriforma conspicua]
MPPIHSLPILLCLLASLAAGAHADSPDNNSIRVLLISGRNNHDWKTTTPKLKAILEADGRFDVTIEEQPQRLTSDRLQSHRVILSNWNTFGRGDKATGDWPPQTRKAYLDFVRNGGGHVVVHAGSSSFADWPEYQQLTLATWQAGQTGHGPPHEFVVRIDASDHPITTGMDDFPIHDELWHRSGIQDGVTVLASAYSDPRIRGSGEFEPVALADTFGSGHSFTLLLGHAAKQMDTPGFGTLLRRGTYWAATGKAMPNGSLNDPFPSPPLRP